MAKKEQISATEWKRQQADRAAEKAERADKAELDDLTFVPAKNDEDNVVWGTGPAPVSLAPPPAALPTERPSPRPTQRPPLSTSAEINQINEMAAIILYLREVDRLNGGLTRDVFNTWVSEEYARLGKVPGSTV